MRERTTVYVVTSGEYSDYRFHCAYTTRVQAEIVAANKGFSVEEMEVYEKPIEPLVVREISANVFAEGTGWYAGYGDNQTFRPDEPRDERRCQYWELDAQNSATYVTSDCQVKMEISPAGISPGPDCIHLRVRGVDLDRVGKVWSERLAEVKAQFDILIEGERQRRTVTRWWKESE